MTGHTVSILRTASYAPQNAIGNAEVARRGGVEPERIERKTRIVSRRYAAAAPWDPPPAGQGKPAAVRPALHRHGVDRLIHLRERERDATTSQASGD